MVSKKSAKPRPEPLSALAKIKLLVLDIDGTLTDGRLYYGAQGELMKAFDVRDGHGLRLLQICGGVKLAALTGRRADLVRTRCKELGIEHIVEKSRAKGPAIEQICQDLGVPLEETCFMGDDVNDLPALEKVGFAACPKDAVPEVRAICDFVSSKKGGRGAVRELCEEILRATVGWPPPEPAPGAFQT
jgi:3-deoxy-D-manno-octulosonate 8-phosphate phosphatase (KDO 8-P phosphatase)